MIAVIKVGGHQAIVEAGEVIRVDKLNAKEGEKVTFETLLITDKDGSNFQLGAPVLDTKVEAKIVEHGRDAKIRVFKMKRRKRYRRTIGHKQDHTVIEITKVGSASAKATADKAAAKKAAPKKTAAKPAAEKKAPAKKHLPKSQQQKKPLQKKQRKSNLDLL